MKPMLCYLQKTQKQQRDFIMSIHGESTAPPRPSLQTEDHNSSPPLWTSFAGLQGLNRSFQPLTTRKLTATRKSLTNTLINASAPLSTTFKTIGQTSCRL